MIDPHSLLAASAVCLAGVMSPGPSFVAVTHRAVSSPRPEALALVVGIVCINSVWAACALFGIGLIFSLFPWMFVTVKLLGAAYLVWFGVQLIRRAKIPLPCNLEKARRSNCAKALRAGVVTNLSNPKAMIFYASVFSAAVPAGTSWPTLAAMVAMVFVISALWYGGLALVLSSRVMAAVYRKIKTSLECVCGLALILFGLRQGLARQ